MFKRQIQKYLGKFFKRRLERYVAKRVLIIFIILSILDIMFMQKPLIGFLGLLLGSALGLVKFSLMISVFARLFAGSNLETLSKTSLLLLMASLSATLVLLAVALAINMALFAGLATGILLVPFVIFLLGIAKGLGISKLDLTNLLQ